MGRAVVPCNWLQIMENSCDPVHTEWLHGKFFEFVAGLPNPASRHTVKIGFDEFEHGIIKRRLLEGQTEDCEDWRVGHPLVFPNILALGSSDENSKMFGFQMRVPIDDTHTQYYWYNAFVPPPNVAIPPRLLDQFDVYDVPFTDEDGEYLTRMIYAQDVMAWVTQGDVADRTRENIGAQDRGITLYRRMLQRELELVERGEDPKGVIRDPARNGIIELPLERNMNARTIGFEASLRRHNVRYSAILEDLIALYAQKPTEPVPA
jgi:5,5'-dehydrodivanillate O-demethylase